MTCRVAILTGGESAEREVCLWSAEFVKPQAKRFFEVEVYDFPQDLKRFLNNHTQIDVAIPVFHGRGGEDGQIQGFLKTLKVPFLFSSIDGHSVGMNKIFTKLMAQSLKINQPPFTIVESKQKIRFRQKTVIKPYDNGSSVGVYIVNNQKELDGALSRIFKISAKAILEEYVDGEEYTVGVIDTQDLTEALPVIWIKPQKSPFFDYKSKYSDGGANEICPAPIPDKLRQKLQNVALLVHKTLGLRHMSRSDFMVDKRGHIFFLEVNTIPGLTKNSLIPKAVKTSGRDFGVLLKEWIDGVSSPRD